MVPVTFREKVLRLEIRNSRATLTRSVELSKMGDSFVYERFY